MDSESSFGQMEDDMKEAGTMENNMAMEVSLFEVNSSMESGDTETI